MVAVGSNSLYCTAVLCCLTERPSSRVLSSIQLYGLPNAKMQILCRSSLRMGIALLLPLLRGSASALSPLLQHDRIHVAVLRSLHLRFTLKGGTFTFNFQTARYLGSWILPISERFTVTKSYLWCTCTHHRLENVSEKNTPSVR